MPTNELAVVFTWVWRTRFAVLLVILVFGAAGLPVVATHYGSLRRLAEHELLLRELVQRSSSRRRRAR